LIPVTYFNTQTQIHDIGFIAHEVQEVYPCLVSGTKNDNEYQSINYNGIIPLLVNEIKLLKAKIDELEKIINTR
jgi:hypothetical protein